MLYIMRHGKTEWNELHKLQGRTDIPLNEEGIRQGKEAGKKPWDCVACGSCKNVCPQQIDIPKYLKELSEKLKA